MCRAGKTFICFATILIWVAGTAYGQSLGDVARQQRQEKQAKKDQPAAKVITNEDLPQPTPSDAEPTGHKNESDPNPKASKSPEEWKALIEAQKQSVANLQRRIDQLGSSIRFVEASRYYTAGQYNERQQQKMEQVQRMQDQLDDQKQRLDQMQEAARKDGFGNAVYDP